MNPNRIHVITVYEVDGKPKPSCDALYLKKGEKVRWEADDPKTTFKIIFDIGAGQKTDNTPTDAYPATGAFGYHKYSIEMLPNGPLLDPSIDIGKP